ncbi:DUF2490 domain-containing protein [Sphingomonas glacialis]|uniref:DUF2490 domain-containing protein n=1 Tax=Sphingomonas glacialis TaxID=658225 RepID=A0A502FFR2_9SPHN|nr:DUF2490 domain-containing protein [Sphingomonas glacialis]TPG48248.1 DUF2490 domain-containing protein [Sphingomonas glacialis]
MKTIACLVSLTLLAAFPSAASAQEQDGEAWASFWAYGPVSGKVLGWVDGSLRMSDRGTDSPTVLIRPLVGVQATKTLSLWGGYTFTASNPTGRAATHEHRAVQQAMWNLGKVAGGTLVSRTRLEQRWVEGRAGTGHRLRQMLRYTTPIDRQNTQFVLSSESFVAFNSTPFGQAAGFDQVRNFVGLNVPLAPKLTADIGYMNRYVRRRDAEDRMDHIVPVTLVARF